MKKNYTKFLAGVLALVLMFGTVMPVQAQETSVTGSYVEITVAARQWSSTYQTYNSASTANQHPITIYIEADEFPVEVSIHGKDSGHSSYTFDTYGTKQVKVEDFGPANAAFALLLFSPLALVTMPIRYATIQIADPADRPKSITAPSKSQTVEAAPQQMSIADKPKALMREIDLPLGYSEYSPYVQELQAFLNSEWDGHSIRDDSTDEGWGGFIATRSIINRTYNWHGTEILSGQTHDCAANIDYIGYLEVVPGVSQNQDFSLAINHAKGVIEEWSLLEQRDAWELNLSGETLVKAVPIGGSNAETRAMVYTTDSEARSHTYALLRGGKILAVS